jgi:hypothetical protein
MKAALVAGALMTMAAAAAAAQPPAAPPASPAFDAAPAEPTVGHDGKPRHDGFFARAALGPGYFYAANKALSASGDRRVFQGGTASLQLAFGGTLTGDFIILGGAYSQDYVFALSSKDSVIDGDEPDLDGYGMTLHSLGLFADVYFGTHSGTHVQVVLGRGWLSVDNPSGNDRDNPSGKLLQLGVGHELWVHDTVLLGALIAVSHGRLQVDEGVGASATLRTLVPTLSVTATIN